MPLKRVLGATDAAWLVAGNMIGAGILFTPGLVAAHLPGAAWHLSAWALGGVLALCGAAVYAELGTRLPRAGGDYQFLQASFGPMWGFLTGWSAFLLTFSGAAAAMAQVAVQHAVAASGVTLPGGETGARLLAPAVVLVLTAANVAGARVSGRTTAMLTAAPLLGLGLLFGYGLLAGSGTIAAPPDPFRPPDGVWVQAMGAAMLPVFFAYSGWNAAAYVAGEVRDPGRNLPRGLLIGTALVTVAYLLVNLVLLWVLPPGVIGGSTKATVLAAERLLGPAAERILSALVALAVLGSANVTLMAGARIYYAMAVDGYAPKALARTNSSGAPGTALWIGGAWTALLSLVGTVGDLVDWTTLAIMLLSSLTVAGLFVLRRRDPAGSAFLCPGYPVVPLVYLVTSLSVAATIFVHEPKHSLWGVLFVAAGIPVHVLLQRQRLRDARTK